MDFTDKIPVLQEQRRQGHSLLRRSRTLLGSGDRVLLTALVSWMEGLTPLVGAATTEAELIGHVHNNTPELLICTDVLEQGTGVSLLNQAKRHRPDLKVLLLVQRPLVRTILQAIDAGCDGICAAELSGSGSVLAALDAMDSDGHYIDRIASGVLSHGQLLGSGGQQSPFWRPQPAGRRRAAWPLQGHDQSTDRRCLHGLDRNGEKPREQRAAQIGRD